MTGADTYLMLVGGEVQAVDLGPMMRGQRARRVEARADAACEIVDLAATGAVSLRDLCVAGVARFGEAATDSALGVLSELAQAGDADA